MKIINHTIQQDSLSIYNNQLNSLKSSIDSLKSELDSIVKINNELNASKNYFSDIISSQMAWFGIIFAVTFGFLGLLYWLGLIKFLQNKFNQSNKDFEAFKKLETLNNDRLNDKIKSLDEKLKTSNENIKSSIEEKIKTVTQNSENLSEKIDNSIQKNSEELTNQIKSQKENFDLDKKELLAKIDKINFEAQKGMFFNNHNRGDHFSALTWSIPMLKSIVGTDSNSLIDNWIHNSKFCVDQMKYDSLMEDHFEELNKQLKEIKKNLTNENNLKDIDYIIKKFNKIYYSNDDTKEKDDIQKKP